MNTNHSNGRRVAVTGMGFITPIGNDEETVWSNMVEGSSGIGAITRFDTTGFDTKIAAEVKGFNPEDYMDRKTARHIGRYCQFALAASKQALAQAGLDPAEMDEHIERMVKHLAVEIDATPEQQQKLAAIAKDAARDLAPLRGQAMETRRQAIELLSAPNIDRGAIEVLRAGKIQQADAASQRIARALADAAEVLTPEQRKTLAQRAARWHGRHRWS